VLQQLQMMGMIHVVHARKMGYAHRYPFERFRARYDYLGKGLERPSAAACAPYYSRHLGAAGAPDGERRECATLLAAMALSGQLEEDGWAVGISKILLKAPQQQQLEVAREAHLRRMVGAQLSNPTPTPTPTPTLTPTPYPLPLPLPLTPTPNP
jgi:myosin heavy subunit